MTILDTEFMCRSSSALGLEQRGDAVNAPAPKPEKVVEEAPSGKEVAEPSSQPELCVLSPALNNDVGAQDVPTGEEESEHIEPARKEPIGKLC